jgi:hypothetical protein
VAEEERRQRDHQHDRGGDEADAADHRPELPARALRAEDRELG